MEQWWSKLQVKPPGNTQKFNCRIGCSDPAKSYQSGSTICRLTQGPFGDRIAGAFYFYSNTIQGWSIMPIRPVQLNIAIKVNYIGIGALMNAGDSLFFE